MQFYILFSTSFQIQKLNWSFKPQPSVWERVRCWLCSRALNIISEHHSYHINVPLLIVIVVWVFLLAELQFKLLSLQDDTKQTHNGPAGDIRVQYRNTQRRSAFTRYSYNSLLQLRESEARELIVGLTVFMQFSFQENNAKIIHNQPFFHSKTEVHKLRSMRPMINQFQKINTKPVQTERKQKYRIQDLMIT